MSERVRRLRPALLALCALAAACVAAPETDTTPAPSPPRVHHPTQRQPNIILVLADDLGAAELGCYGQTKIATPNIDRLAREGARFTQFYSAAPVCAPSRCALLTGLHLGHAPIRDNAEVEPEGQAPLPLGFPTLAQDLLAANYETACIGKWGLGFIATSGDPLNVGFRRFFGYNCQREAHNAYPTHLWRNAGIVPLAGNDPKTRKEAVYAPGLLLDDAEKFIASNAGRPFFLAYTTTLPHLALQPPADALARYQGRFPETPYKGRKGYLPHPEPRAAYAAMISRLDDEVGALRTAVDKAGIADDTIIVITSDNGATHDVGGVDTVFFDSTGGLRGRKGSLWEGGLRVPCIVWAPGRIAEGRTIDSPAWSVDLRATFAALAGAEPPNTDGVDLVPLLTAGAALPERAFYWPFPGYGAQEAVREGRWKIVRRDLATRAKTGEIKPLDGWQLFDLATDPNETRDLAAQHPEIVARLAEIAARAYQPNTDFPLPGRE